MNQATRRDQTLLKCFALSLFYASFWMAMHYSFIALPFEPWWLIPQIISSTLIFFTFNGLFLSFDYYRWGWIPQGLTSILYIQPFLQLLYFQTYKSFLDQQNLSVILREPYFLIKVFVMEISPKKAIILLLTMALAWAINHWVLRRKNLSVRRVRPYDVFLHWANLLFMAIMIALQIKWCLENDTSQLGMRPVYPVTLMAIISILVYLIRTAAPVWERVCVFLLLTFNIWQLYSLNIHYIEESKKFTLDQQYYRAFFGAFYVQSPFRDMDQNEKAQALYDALPVAKMDYNILVSLNDAQRWDLLSSNGYKLPTDEDLYPFYKKSFNFQFPISPANFTDTSVPSIFLGMGSDQDLQRIKSSLPLWDYFSKGAKTFFVSSQDVSWSKLNLFYDSYGQKHIWSAPQQPGYKGGSEDALDVESFTYLRDYIHSLKKPWVGVWQTYASHYPYSVEDGFDRYLPCETSREYGTEHLENCYLNAQGYSAYLRKELFESLDMTKTVIILTSDHGEGFGEHGVYYHGIDYHEEMVKVPFNLYIPPALLEKLPKEAVENLKANTHKITSVMDLVPTLLHLHQMLTGQNLRENQRELTGKSLFTKWDYRVVFSSHCFPQYRCYSREILFASDDYYVLFRPNEGFYKIYDTWKDLKQTHPLSFDEIDHKKFEALIDEAARIHPAGQVMKAYYEQFKSNGFK